MLDYLMSTRVTFEHVKAKRRLYHLPPKSLDCMINNSSTHPIEHHTFQALVSSRKLNTSSTTTLKIVEDNVKYK